MDILRALAMAYLGSLAYQRLDFRGVDAILAVFCKKPVRIDPPAAYIGQRESNGLKGLEVIWTFTHLY